MPRFLICLVFGWALAAPVLANSHVRVVLDISASMKKNDPNQLALLATALLHDLARPNTTLGESFEVIPFDASFGWASATDPPPESKSTKIVARFGDRPRFMSELLKLPYSGRETHYYPGIKRSITDLAGIPASSHDIKIIVLVTDGLPEKFSKDESELIRRDLLPEIEKHGLRLYVIAFGPDASANVSFFDPLVLGAGGADLGSVFVDADGSRLLRNMLEIFGRSFGFAPDADQPLPVASLDLALGTSNPERVAVVVSTPRENPPSQVKLQPPMGGGLNLDGQLEKAKTSGASYALQWVLSPDPGRYGLATDAGSGMAAVLRPTRVDLTLQPVPPSTQVARLMAGRPFPIGLLVKPATGASGDPGPVTVKFFENGERSTTAKNGYEWSKNKRAPVSNAGVVSSAGRLFELRVEFPENSEKPGELYAGHLEVEVHRREALVGSLNGLTAHRFEVHPLLGLTPRPLDYTTPVALGRRETVCTDFLFDLVGHLPHPNNPVYAVRSELELADLKQLESELHQASFTLDGRPLEIQGQPAPNPGEWYNGRQLSSGELLGTHQFCITTGKPKAGNPATPLPLRLRMTLLDSPYDDLRVIEPFTLKALIAPPGVLEKWGALILALLTFLGLLALLWHMRNYPTIPPDLGFAVAREGSSLVPRPFPPASPWARLFATVAERPLTITGEENPLGWVRPVDAELYQLRLPAGCEVAPEKGGAKLAIDRRRRATVAVHHTYRIRGPRGSYLLRLEYQ